jgi:hypothetical protein
VNPSPSTERGLEGEVIRGKKKKEGLLYPS